VDFTPKQYLLIYALIVTPIVISFFFIRRSQNPTRLNLNSRAQKTAKTAPMVEGGKSIEFEDDVSWHSGTVATEKDLNLLFQWNGHTWDAYEVLGVPAGSSLIIVKESYQLQLTRSTQDAHPFLNAAFETIVKNASSG
jgi:hypothetical protein